MKSIVKVIFLIFLLIPILYGCSSNNSEAPSIPTIADQAPIVQTFAGPSECGINQTCSFQATGVDPDGNKVAFHFGYWVTVKPHTYKELDFTEYVNNYEPVTVSIGFDLVGQWTVCCYCKDQKGNESAHLQREVDVS